MIITRNKKLFFIKCLVYALIVYTIVICSFIMWAVDSPFIQSKYLQEGVYVYYSGKPIFNPFSIFEYLTTLNSLFIATCILLLGISVFPKFDKLARFITNIHIWSYISTILVFMFIAVLTFDLITLFDAYRELIPYFGFSFISVTMMTSRFVLHHALLFYYALLLKKGFRPTYDEKKNYIPYIVIAAFYILWYLMVNVIGKSAYGTYQWYPYILIMPDGFFEFCHMKTNTFLYIIYYIGLIGVLIAMEFAFHFAKKLLNRISLH